MPLRGLRMEASSKLARWFALLVLGCFCWNRCLGSIHYYDFSGFDRSGNADIYFGGTEGMYASSMHTRQRGVANGKSFINIDVDFFRTPASAARHGEMEYSTGLVEAILLRHKDEGYIGHSFRTGEKVLCCTPEFAKELSCTVGAAILKKRDEWPLSIKTNFRGRDLKTKLSTIVNITETDLYSLYFVSCEPQLEGLRLRGRTEWKNPTGYLPGRMATLQEFYGYLSLAYLLLGFIWLVQYARFWKDILQLQNCISLVIFLGHTETALWYFEYANFNQTGRRPMGITMWAVTISALRKTVSHVLILIVSMGYGVVRPTLGGITGKVLLAGAAYFAAVEALDVVENVRKVDDFSNKGAALLVLPVSIISACFIVWIFSSLARTLEKLQARKQTAKLELYKNFTNALALAVLASILWIGFEYYFKYSDAYDQKWRIAWVIPAFWNLLAFIMLCVICYLWKPSRNATRYAYSEELGEDPFDEECVQLTSTADARETPAPTEDRRPQTNTDAFSLDDEEDKRE